MDVEKGAWFKIGVNVQNTTDESKDVYVSVKNVEVRIASAKEVEDSNLSAGQTPSEEDAAQQETDADMQVSNILNGNSPVTVLREDALIFRAFIAAGEMPVEHDAIQNILLYERPE